jgi:isopentenyl diphosphate isomerase/L-lactate dehydrogenase-like FMN-dependent dehydrogenase
MSAFTYKLSSGTGAITVEDYRVRARRAVPDMVWAYIDYGAEELRTLAANRSAFDQYRLKMRVLTGNEAVGLGVQVAGQQISLPVVLAPTGLVGLSHWTGELGAAQAAERAGTLSVLSTGSSYSLEEVAAGTDRGHFFQLYPWADPVSGGHELIGSLLQRAGRAGYTALFVTVDVPVRGNREAESRRGMGNPPVLTPARLLNAARKPRWCAALLRYQRISMRTFVDSGGARSSVRSIYAQSRMMRPQLSWDDFAWIRDHWDGPLFIKGVLDADDAAQAVALGATGVVVSNHGGRQLDHAVASLDALPAIVRRVGGRAEVLVDGGVRRGSDVIKALCLGATAVCIGRPYLYGMAAAGPRGAAHVIDILRTEMARCMTLMGIAGIADLGPELLLPAGKPLS